jgi:carboxyl-terminal processing protease
MKKKLMIMAGASMMVAATLVSVAKTSSPKSDMLRNLSIFSDIYSEIQTNYVDTIDADKTMRRAIDVMLGQIDPYTEYYNIDQTEDVTSISSGQYAGVGSSITKRSDGVVFSYPFWDSPARRAGIRHGDIILEVNGDTITKDTQLKGVTTKLKGSPGTTATVKVKRPGSVDSIQTFTITRENIKIAPIPYSGYAGDGVGYIKIETFNEETAGDFNKALQALLADSRVKGIVIDLRNNGGGVLEGAVKVASNFVPKGTEIVTTRYRGDEQTKVYKTTTSPLDLKIPLAILVDYGTASASEILSGSLQDLDRAVIIGERTYGKGLVQSTRPICYGGLLKLTVARYYIPSGRLIQAIDYSKRDSSGRPTVIADSLTKEFKTANGRIVRDGGGITPDVKVEQPEMNRLLYNLSADMWVWDFSNRYANNHPEAPDPDTWQVGDSIFNEFKSFVDPDKFKYDRAGEEGIKYLRDAAKVEGFDNDSVNAVIDRLEAMIKHDLNHDLDFNKKDIIELLDNELSDRYFSPADCVKRAIRGNDLELREAKAVLNDTDRYNSLLSPKKDEKQQNK